MRQQPMCKMKMSLSIMIVIAGHFLEQTSTAKAQEIEEVSCKLLEKRMLEKNMLNFEWKEIHMEAHVVEAHAPNPIAITVLCPNMNIKVFCLEYQNDGIHPGDKVEVDGLVSGTVENGVVLDPCNTIKRDRN